MPAATPEETEEAEAAPLVDDVLMAALDAPVAQTEVAETPPEEEEEESEPTIADYKWKDTVLDAVLSKFEITDRDAFLDHAMAFDGNGNRYLTKPELTAAGKAWSEAHPGAEPDPEPAPELPPAPMPAPEATVAVAPAPAPAAPAESESASPTDDYGELWKRRSNKSLPQMYGAIDRIGSGEIGSLLDRYSDRFGHELDREIIVMRKAEQDARREAVPTVELLSAPDVPTSEEPADDAEEEDEVTVWLSEVENLLRPLQNAYKSADSKAEKKRLAPALKALIAERKTLLAVLEGELDEDALDDLPERPEMPDLDEDEPEEETVEVTTATEADDDFPAFFDIINNLLGEMPEDWVDAFLSSKGFKLFQNVGADPAGTDTRTRKRFFNMINSELGDMPEDLLDAFVTSPDFQLYQTMGEIYGA